MFLSLNKFLQSNFPHKSVLSLSNAIVGASVLSMGYCFQQVYFVFVYENISNSNIFLLVWNYFSNIINNNLWINNIIFM